MQLNELRNAWEALYVISDPNDDRGYQWIAGRHGFPGNYCHRSAPDFWVWHRAFMYEFEESLRDAQEREQGLVTATVPYWDWTVFDEETDDEQGLPKACSEEEYTDLLTGETKPNPLRSAFSIATNANTFRDPRRLRDYIPQAKTQVERIMAQSDYLTSQRTMDMGPHGAIHVRVGGAGGGDMRSIRTAAFDPIFWLHHSFVDKIWWDWQQEHGNASVPQEQREFVTAPWSYTGEQCLDAEGFFRYTYRQQEVFQGFDAVESASARRGARRSKSRSSMAVSLGEVSGGVRRASLELHQLSKTEHSYEIRVFLNHRNATAGTPTEDNPKYAGSLYVFGHGECVGQEGHCDYKPRRERDRRPQHHYTPYNTSLDITAAVQVATEGLGANESKSLSVAFVVLDAAGKKVDPEEIRFDGLSLETDG